MKWKYANFEALPVEKHSLTSWNVVQSEVKESKFVSKEISFGLA